jgi:hypothetical protein
MDIVSRAKNILITPQTEWAVIESERTDPASLYVGYICILAAIPAVAIFIGMLILGLGFAFAIELAIIQYVSNLVTPFISGFIAAKLAPSFGGQDDVNQGLKLVAYSMTPRWIAGILYIIPGLRWIALIASLYGIYLVYLGVPVLMKTPGDKTIVYMIVVFIVTAVITAIIGGILAALIIGGGFGSFGMM